MSVAWLIAEPPNARWVDDMAEIPTVDKHATRDAKLCLATVIDLQSRRLLDVATRVHPEAGPVLGNQDGRCCPGLRGGGQRVQMARGRNPADHLPHRLRLDLH